MRKELIFIIGAHIAFLLYALWEVADLLTLLYDDTFKDALLESELNPSANMPERPLVVPKIIHQTYKNTSIPEIWKEGQQACIDLHPDYQYILWTDEMARNFIKEKYPWFLKTFDSYPYNIMRADTIRYFVLSYYGGIYIDLDDACIRRLDPLLTVPATLRRTYPNGISNDVMATVPRHPFFLKAIENLEKYDRNWLIPYMTIMYSTGPLFLSVMWKKYKRWGVPDAGRIRILMPSDYKMHTMSFFAINKGDSWHLGDAQFIKKLGVHWVLATIGGFLLVFLVMGVEYCFYCALTSQRSKRWRKRCFIKIFRLLPQRYNTFQWKTEFDDMELLYMRTFDDDLERDL